MFLLPITDMFNMWVIYSLYTWCIVGYYCPASTNAQPLRTPKPCPVETYGNREGLEAESDCTTCDAGFYCETTGKDKLMLCSKGDRGELFIT